MKEILKEWKKFLNETKPTDKWFDKFGGEPSPKSKRTPMAPMYDRAVTKSAGQGDFRSTFKVWLGQFLRSNFGIGNMEFLVSKMEDTERVQAIRDLNIMRYIYSGKSPWEIYNTDNVKTGVMYDNQPDIKGSAVEKIDAVLNDMGEQPSLETPTDEEMQEIYVYYINPNYQTVLSEPEETKSTRFTGHLTMAQNPEFIKRQQELDAINRQKAIQRKKELAQRRRRRQAEKK